MNLQGILKAWNRPCIFLLVIAFIPGGWSNIAELPLARELQSCYDLYATGPVQIAGKSISWYCEGAILRRLRTGIIPQKPSQRRYTQSLAAKAFRSISRRGKRQAEKCIRKEYRTLTDRERQNLHLAFQRLKDDTDVEPNRYDAIAMLHTGIASSLAHGGPNFYGWHRVYLLLLETALKEKVPGVCIPYWDSSLDNDLEYPEESYMFSEKFIGNGNGPVQTGPFAGWRFLYNGSVSALTRNAGNDGQLFRRTAIEDVLSRRSHSEIIGPLSSPQYNLEMHHGGIHVFIGGQMEQLETAAFDPVFFLHHCFVDYIWELFRTKQKSEGIDPVADYPRNAGNILHERDAPMGFLNITTSQGYSDEMTSSYEYAPSPDCSSRRPTCETPNLRCNLASGRCLPINPDITPPDPVTPAPTTPISQTPPPPGPKPPRPCKKQLFPKPQQNTFCVNGICDIHEWVYIPVKVVTIRPPSFDHYNSYPIYNGSISRVNDIYQPKAYSKTNRIIVGPRGKPKTFDHCVDETGMGQVYVQSLGINYEGFYKESAIVDQRLATSITVAYVAVKDPGRHGTTTALLRAFDSCGRICHTSCRKAERSSEYVSCSGAVSVDSRPPLRYSRNYGDAILDVWGYDGSRNCPTFKTDQFYLTFYCDYRDRLPWAGKSGSSGPPRPPPSPVTPAPVTNPNECRVDADCILDFPCPKGKRQCRLDGEQHICRGSCNRYAVCSYGRYWSRSCAWNRAFSERWHTCTTRKCPSTARTTSPFHRDLSPFFPQRNNNYFMRLGSRMFGGSRNRFSSFG